MLLSPCGKYRIRWFWIRWIKEFQNKIAKIQINKNARCNNARKIILNTFDCINSNYTIVKAGLPASLETVNVCTLIQMMQKNEKYVYWLQRKNSDFETQIPAVNVNGSFYQPSFKLEKAIFRHIRLTRNFQNYELMEDGNKKLRIPIRLWKEKQRTSTKFSVRLRAICKSITYAY